ncbi:MAG: CBS domain-containing protein [Betaproteobacteria bacterium]|nr:CBS domain-containing protein [Betaproteobacteria bacterium]
MQVQKYMSAPALTVRADSDYRSGFDLMRQKNLHHLPVVDGKGRLVGIVAQRDMLLAAMHYQNAPIEMAEVMHQPVISTKPDLPIVEAARLMLRRQIGCLPVVDAKLAVTGIITESDLFAVFVRMLSARSARPAKKTAPKKAQKGGKKAAKRRATRR